MRNLLTLTFLLFTAELFSQAKGNANINEGNVNFDKNSNYYNSNNNPNTSLKSPAVLPVAQIVDDKIITLEVNALSNQPANSYTVIFNLKQIGKTAEEADKLFNERYNAFVSDAVLEGVRREDIYLDMVSFVPVYEFEEEKKLFSKKTYNEIPKGFEIQQNVHINYKESKMLGRLVSAAAKSEVYDIVKVDYFVNKTEEIYQDLRKRAVEYINKEISQFEALGVELDAAYRVAAEEEKSAYPIDRYSSYSAYSAQSLDGTTKGKVNHANKAVTMYYDKIPYDKFEIIVNPTILEPVVQYMYNLKVRFKLKQPELPVKIEREKEFLWLSPTGELKTLKIEKEEDNPQLKPASGNKTVIPEQK